jgi:hypothetical protein
MKKRNYGNNLGRPIAYRLCIEDENILGILANAAGVSPGILTREYMENLLRNFKLLADNSESGG